MRYFQFEILYFFFFSIFFSKFEIPRFLRFISKKTKIFFPFSISRFVCFCYRFYDRKKKE